eukprot:Amastigsp_a345603_17.p6 type:complete len:135 gc:universal Amastigsp_a345603_17:1-405(+)
MGGHGREPSGCAGTRRTEADYPTERPLACAQGCAGATTAAAHQPTERPLEDEPHWCAGATTALLLRHSTEAEDVSRSLSWHRGRRPSGTAPHPHGAHGQTAQEHRAPGGLPSRPEPSPETNSSARSRARGCRSP